MKRSINLCLKDPNGRYLLQMRDGKSGILYPLQWCFFGGEIEGEESPEECASRELKEELGVWVEPSKMILLDELEVDYLDYVYFFEVPKKFGWKDFEVLEGAGIAGFTPEEILRLPPTRTTMVLTQRNLLQN